MLYQLTSSGFRCFCPFYRGGCEQSPPQGSCFFSSLGADARRPPSFLRVPAGDRFCTAKPVGSHKKKHHPDRMVFSFWNAAGRVELAASTCAHQRTDCCRISRRAACPQAAAVYHRCLRLPRGGVRAPRPMHERGEPFRRGRRPRRPVRRGGRLCPPSPPTCSIPPRRPAPPAPSLPLPAPPPAASFPALSASAIPPPSPSAP